MTANDLNMVTPFAAGQPSSMEALPTAQVYGGTKLQAIYF
jgi:hypothetical protein